METLSPERWQQINTLLDHLFELPADQHTAFLNQACRNDTALYRQLQAALRANRDDEPFLDALDNERLALLMQTLDSDDVARALQHAAVEPLAWLRRPT